MRHAPRLIDIQGTGAWILKDTHEVENLNSMKDRQFIESYNHGLRQIYLPLESQVHSELFLSKINALNYLLKKFEFPQVKFLYQDEKSLKKIIENSWNKTLDTKKRGMLTFFRRTEILTTSFLPHSIYIDMTRCDSCDDCVKVCSSQAIRIKSSNGNLFYSITPEQCDRCELCESLCHLQAIQVSSYNTNCELKYPIEQKNCSHCGHLFHINQNLKNNSKNLCPVCITHKHPKGSARIVQTVEGAQ